MKAVPGGAGVITRRRAPAPPLDALIVLNPVAARYPRGRVHQALRGELLRRRRRFRIIKTDPHEETRSRVEAAIREAVAEGCRRVIVVGGDGTIEVAAAGLASAGGAECALGVIPAGTANVLAGELGIPGSLDDAIALAVDGAHTLTLDGIETGGHLILTQVGVGPDAQMIRESRREELKRHGRLAYLFAFWRRLRWYRPCHFDLVVDGRAVSVRAWQIVVANVGSAGAPPFTYGPGIDPTDGRIDVCIYDPGRAGDFWRIVWRIATGRHRRDLRTRYVRAEREVVIGASRPMWVQGDGEMLGRTPITLRLAPGAVRIVVPNPVASEMSAPRAREGEPAESVAAEMTAMVGERAPTWLQHGLARHPIAALAAFDAAAFIRLNALSFGPWVDRILLGLSRLMHYGEGWAAVAVVMVIARPSRGIATVAEALPVLWATMLTVNFPLKRLFARRRPFTAYVKTRVVGARPADFSFPSGHSAAAFAGALLLSAHAPAWAPAFFALAGLVGFARVYLGVHYPGDVIVGAGTGMALAVGYRGVFQWMAGLVH